MSVFSYDGPVEEMGSGGGPKAGSVQLKVSNIEEVTSQKGTRYIKVELQDDREYTIKHSFFPFSSHDYPKKAFADFLIVAGFYVGGKVDISQWSDIIGREVVALCQLETYYWDGKDRTKRVPHSFYDMSYKSAKEIADGSTEAKSFLTQKEYVDKNPHTADSSAGTSNAGVSSNDDAPF